MTFKFIAVSLLVIQAFELPAHAFDSSLNSKGENARYRMEGNTYHHHDTTAPRSFPSTETIDIGILAHTVDDDIDDDSDDDDASSEKGSDQYSENDSDDNEDTDGYGDDDADIFVLNKLLRETFSQWSWQKQYQKL